MRTYKSGTERLILLKKKTKNKSNAHSSRLEIARLNKAFRR